MRGQTHNKDIIHESKDNFNAYFVNFANISKETAKVAKTSVFQAKTPTLSR